MARLSDKLKQGADAIAGFELAVEKDVDKLIERTNEVHKKRERVFLNKHTKLDEHVTDLAEFDKELDAFDNGAPPLDDGATAGETTDDAGERKAWQPPKTA